jgi:hypothetical protein
MGDEADFLDETGSRKGGPPRGGGGGFIERGGGGENETNTVMTAGLGPDASVGPCGCVHTGVPGSGSLCPTIPPENNAPTRGGPAGARCLARHAAAGEPYPPPSTPLASSNRVADTDARAGTVPSYFF